MCISFQPIQTPKSYATVVAMLDSCDESECSELKSSTAIDCIGCEMFEPNEQGKVSRCFAKRSSGEILLEDCMPGSGNDHAVLIV